MLWLSERSGVLIPDCLPVLTGLPPRRARLPSLEDAAMDRPIGSPRSTTFSQTAFSQTGRNNPGCDETNNPKPSHGLRLGGDRRESPGRRKARSRRVTETSSADAVNQVELELLPGESIVIGDYRIELLATNELEVTLQVESELGIPCEVDLIDNVELTDDNVTQVPPRRPR